MTNALLRVLVVRDCRQQSEPAHAPQCTEENGLGEASLDTGHENNWKKGLSQTADDNIRLGNLCALRHVRREPSLKSFSCFVNNFLTVVPETFSSSPMCLLPSMCLSTTKPELERS